MSYIKEPDPSIPQSFLNVIKQLRIKTNIEQKYRNDVRNIWGKTVREEFPLLHLTISFDGSPSYFFGIGVTKETFEKLPLKESDRRLAQFGMPMVGVLLEDFEKNGAIIFDAYHCINLDAFYGTDDPARHVYPPTLGWAGITEICTHKRTIGIDQKTCISRPIHSATEIYLEYRRMDETGEGFRLPAWPHGG